MGNQPRIIFVNRYFYPDHSATSQMLSDLAFALADEGRSITIVTSRQRYDDPSARLPTKESIKGVEIVRVWTSRFGRSNLLGRSSDYLSFYFSAATSLLWRIKRGDIVVAKTDPPMLSLLSAPLCWVKGAKAVNWLQDLFPEVAEASELGRGRVARTLFAILKKFRNASLSASHQNIAIGRRMALRLRASGLRPERITTLSNWADGRLITPVASTSNPLRAAWSLEDAFVVAYSGNLGRAHEIDTMLQAMKCLQAQQHSGENTAKPQIVWLFIGAGAQMESLQKAVTTRGFTNVRFQPYQPRETLSQSLSVGDVHLVSLRPELEGLIVPSKYYGIAAAGRPAIFIGDQQGEVATLLKDYQAGIAVACGDADGLARAILTYRDDEALRLKAGANARMAFEHHHDLPAVVQSWQQLLDALTMEEQEHARVAPTTASAPISVREL